MMTFFDPAIVRNIMPYAPEEISAVVEKDGWNIGGWKEAYTENLQMELHGDRSAILFPAEFMARSVTYAQRKYPGCHRETGIFATMVAGYTTGLFGGYGQDQDPLYGKAEDVVLALAGGVPASIHDPAGIIGVDAPWNDGGINLLGGIVSKQEFTRAAIRLLEGVCYTKNSRGPIEEAIMELEKTAPKPDDPGNEVAMKAYKCVQRTKAVLRKLS